MCCGFRRWGTKTRRVLVERPVKFFNRTSIGCGRDEAVVFFSRASSQGLKPVRVVRCPAADRPFFHGRCRLVCDFSADGRALFHGLKDAVVGLVGQVRAHHMEVEHILSEVLRDLVGRSRLVVGHAVEDFVQGLLTAQAHGFEFLAKVK